MSEVLSNNSPEILRTVETAKVVRDGLLNLFNNGTLGSNQRIPETVADRAVQLPGLLRYSPQTLRHFQTIVQTLAQPREFQLSRNPLDAWQDDTEISDVVYQAELFGDSFVFPNQLTSPYLDPMTAAIVKSEAQPHQVISLQRFRDKSFSARLKPQLSLNDVWKLAYDYDIGYPSTVLDPQFLEGASDRARSNVGGGGFYADMRRVLLLQFVLVPHSVNAQFFLQHFYPSDYGFAFSTSHKVPFGPTDNFDVYNITFEPAPLIQQLAKTDGPHASPDSLFTKNALVIHLLKRTGLSHISIVGLGQLRIGNQTYSIYSQSELPRVTVEQNQPKWALQTQRKPSLT